MNDNDIILPEDDEWHVDADAQIIAGAAYSRDDFVFAISLSSDEYYEFDNYCRFIKFENGNWVMTEIGDRIVSIIPQTIEGSEKAGAICLSWEGQVVFMGEEVTDEKIETAGLDGRSYVNQIFDFSGQLFVCGDRGQVYRRTGKDSWVETDEGLSDFSRVEPGEINTFSIDALYSFDLSTSYAGGGLDLETGILFHRKKAEPWNKIEIPFDFGPVKLITQYHSDTLLVAGLHFAFLLRPDFNTSQLEFDPAVPKNINFTSVTYFNDTIFMAGNRGLCILKDDKVCLVEGFDHMRVRPQIVQRFEDVLWVFGYNAIARFDGTNWNYYAPPGIRL